MIINISLNVKIIIERMSAHYLFTLYLAHDAHVQHYGKSAIKLTLFFFSISVRMNLPIIKLKVK